MVNEVLIKYILKFHKKGFSSESIAKRLINDGWSKIEIQEAFKVAQQEIINSYGFSKRDYRRSSFRIKHRSLNDYKKRHKISGWKKRIGVIMSLLVLLAIAVLTVIWVFS